MRAVDDFDRYVLSVRRSWGDSGVQYEIDLPPGEELTVGMTCLAAIAPGLFLQGSKAQG